MTRLVFDPVETIRKDIETWDSPFVELDCYGTDNAGQIATKNTMGEPNMFEEIFFIQILTA